MVLGVYLRVVKPTNKLSEVGDLDGVRAFHLIHIRENTERVANDDFFAQLFAHFAFEAGDDVLTEIYVAAGNLVDAGIKLFRCGTLGKEDFLSAAKVVMDERTGHDDLLAYGRRFAIVYEFCHSESVTHKKPYEACGL